MAEKQKIQSVHVFNTTQILVVDIHGEQIAELQDSLITLWAERAESLGYEVDGATVLCTNRTLKLFKTEEGFNFEVL